MYYLEHVVCAKFFKFAITLKYIYRKSVYDIKTNEKINYYIPSNISVSVRSVKHQCFFFLIYKYNSACIPM